jgi:hypothetical protein
VLSGCFASRILMVRWLGNQVFAVNEGLVSRRSIPVLVQPHPHGRLFFEIVDDRLAFRTLWKVLHKCRVHFMCLKRRQGWVLGSSSMVNDYAGRRGRRSFIVAGNELPNHELTLGFAVLA